MSYRLLVLLVFPQQALGSQGLNALGSKVRWSGFEIGIFGLVLFLFAVSGGTASQLEFRGRGWCWVLVVDFCDTGVRGGRSWEKSVYAWFSL